MMTDSDILRAWERGEGKPPVEQALILLGCGHPDRPAAELARLSIGERDALLLQLREQLLGSTLRGYVECPRCGERLVFKLQSADLRAPAASPQPDKVLCVGDWTVQFRLLDSNDLIAVAREHTVRAVRAKLLSRCLLLVAHGGEPLSTPELPPEVEAALIAALAAEDPQAELFFGMHCAACRHAWRVLFDIAVFFWTEFSTRARDLLDEIATLARVYGWREEDILSMSTRRRQQYVQRALS